MWTETRVVSSTYMLNMGQKRPNFLALATTEQIRKSELFSTQF